MTQQIANHLWGRVGTGKEPGEVIYALTLKDAAVAIEERLDAEEIPIAALTNEEIEEMFRRIRDDLELPWDSTMKILLDKVWPDDYKLRGFTHNNYRAKSGGEFYTTSLFSQDTAGTVWECECSADFIYPRSQAQCPECRAVHDECPGARVGDVRANQDKFPALAQFMEEACASYQAGLSQGIQQGT